jgi:hypothetical protein
MSVTGRAGKFYAAATPVSAANTAATIVILVMVSPPS